jgi:hypothetical protein
MIRRIRLQRLAPQDRKAMPNNVSLFMALLSYYPLGFT